jgi:serine/threonine protein kinase
VERASGRQVALKVMAAELSGDAELVERFRREAMAAAALVHPNVTQVYDFGENGHQLYMAMELLSGSDLKGLVDRKELGDLAWRLRIMLKVADAMGFVHSRNIVHRDLKPGNIQVMPNGSPKIMDFGLVRIGDSSMTRTGMVMGSPSYMSPEQLKGDKADARSDVFSLGAVFYELLAGQRAFGGKGIAQIMMAVLQSEPPPLEQVAPGTPLPLVAIVERCLRKDVAVRYQSAGELHAAIEVAHAVYAP